MGRIVKAVKAAACGWLSSLNSFLIVLIVLTLQLLCKKSKGACTATLGAHRLHQLFPLGRVVLVNSAEAVTLDKVRLTSMFRPAHVWAFHLSSA